MKYLKHINWTRISLIFLIICINVGCDQQTKLLAVEHIKDGVDSFFLNNTFVLTYAENKGAFFSLGSDWSGQWQALLLVILPASSLLVLTLFTFFSRSLSAGQMLALSCIIGGGLSNIYDRIAHGAVVDFMNMGIGEWRTGIFNFADVSIMVGMFLLFFFNMRKP